MNKFKIYKKKFISLKKNPENKLDDIELFNKRVEKIWNYICRKSNRKLIWWSFRNDKKSLNFEATDGGNFDPIKDRFFVKIKGDFSKVKDKKYPYNKGFPTNLIWNKNWKAKIKKVKSKGN